MSWFDSNQTEIAKKLKERKREQQENKIGILQKFIRGKNEWKQVQKSLKLMLEKRFTDL